MKNFKQFILMLLAVIIVLNTNITAFANTVPPQYAVTKTENNSVIITDEGIHINGIYYSQEKFIKLLETAQEIELSKSRSALALVAGTWYIPGVGEIVITVVGTIIVAGAVVEVGSWVYNAVIDWFEVRAFNQSAEDAVNSCDSNKQNHIMQSKHNWNKFNKNPKWSDVSPILIKVLKDGTEKWERDNQYIRTFLYKGENVVVRFIKDSEGLVKYISTAWCK